MARRALVLGAGGQLGRTVGKVFSSRGWMAIGADAFSTPSLAHVLPMDAAKPPEEQARALLEGAQAMLRGEQLDAVVNVAGGFAMGSAQDSAMVERTRVMIESSVYSSVVAAHLASSVMRPGGLLVLPGAAAALSPTPWSLPYGTAKAAVHHLVRSLAEAEAAGLPSGAKTVGLAPQVLDTPQNREAMPDADVSMWATLDEVAEQLEAWCADPSGVESGMVYVVRKDKGQPATFEMQAPL